MPKMSEVSTSLWKHILVYGPPKAGKTELVGKLSEEFELIWLDVEFGADTLKFLPKEWQDRIDYYGIPDSKAFPIAVETLMKLFAAKKGSICAAHGKFNCPLCTKDKKEQWPIDLTNMGPKKALVIDSWTQVVLSAMGNISRNKPDDYKFEYDDWGHLKNTMENLLSQIQGAPFHVVVISHEDVVEMVDKTEKIVPVGGSSKTSRNMAKYFGEVVYVQVVNGKHKVVSSTTAMNKVLTGSRARVTFEKDEAPRLLDVFKHNSLTEAVVK